MLFLQIAAAKVRKKVKSKKGKGENLLSLQQI